MKLILPILICSAISAALGYYFGTITTPADAGEGAAPETVASTETAGTAETAETTGAAGATGTIPTEPEAPDPDTEPVPEPDEPSEANADETGTDDESESSFADRAASTTQTLTDKDGRTIEVSILEVMDDKLRIRRNDGLKTTIPLNMLSDEDVAFCEYLREQQEEEEEEEEEAATPDTSDGFDWDEYFNS